MFHLGVSLWCVLNSYLKLRESLVHPVDGKGAVEQQVGVHVASEGRENGVYEGSLGEGACW